LIDHRPKAILLDEPFANIDIGHQPLVIAALQRRQQAGQAIVCAVQQLHLVPDLGGQVLGLGCGHLEVNGPALDILTETNLEKLFRRKGRLVQTAEGFSGLVFEPPR
jgi:ABC-type hemin transport system ATPase subunit